MRNDDRRETRSSGQLIIVGAILCIGRLSRVLLAPDSEIVQRPARRLVAVAGVIGRAEFFGEALQEIVRVESAEFRDGFEHHKRAIPIVRLFARLFAKVVVAFEGRFEPMNTAREALLQLGQVIDPVTAKAEGISDQLSPDRAA